MQILARDDGLVELAPQHDARGALRRRREARVPVDGVEVRRDVVLRRVAVLAHGQLQVRIIQHAAREPLAQRRQVGDRRRARELVEARPPRVVGASQATIPERVDDAPALAVLAGVAGRREGIHLPLGVAHEVPQMLEPEALGAPRLRLEHREEEQVVPQHAPEPRRERVGDAPVLVAAPRPREGPRPEEPLAQGHDAPRDFEERRRERRRAGVVDGEGRRRAAGDDAHAAALAAAQRRDAVLDERALEGVRVARRFVADVVAAVLPREERPRQVGPVVVPPTPVGRAGGPHLPGLVGPRQPVAPAQTRLVGFAVARGAPQVRVAAARRPERDGVAGAHGVAAARRRRRRAAPPRGPVAVVDGRQRRRDLPPLARADQIPREADVAVRVVARA